MGVTQEVITCLMGVTQGCTLLQSFWCLKKQNVKVYYAVNDFLHFDLGLPGLDCLEGPNQNEESLNSIKLYVHVLREVIMLCGQRG